MLVALSYKVVCRRSEVLASGCAISRSFPPFTLKSGATGQTVQVGFILSPLDLPLIQADMDCLNALNEGIHLTQEMVDKPAGIMNTDAFIEVSSQLTCVPTKGKPFGPGMV